MAETVSIHKIHDIEWCLSRANDHIKTVNTEVEKLKARLNAIKKDVDMVPTLAEEIVKLQNIVLLLANETKGEKEEVKLQKLVQSLTNETMGEEEG